jgi:transcriptional regulator with GAF, ATPase, and Fis domain
MSGPVQTTPVLREEATGFTYPLHRRLETIGSARECTITIAGLDPFCAQILYDNGAYRLQPISPAARVELNGRRLRSAVTPGHGDHITIGKRRFVFALHPEERADDVDGAARPDPVLDLIGVIASLIQDRNRDVSQGLVTSVSKLLRCDAARLVMEETASGRRGTVACFPSDAPADRFSTRAIEWAARERRTVRMHQLDWSDGGDSEHSLETNRVATVLCAPLIQGERVAGFLYLDRLEGSPPFDDRDRRLCNALAPLFAEILSDAAEHRKQRETIARFQEARSGESEGLVYESDAMKAAMKNVRTFAATDAPVLILGETGTGKELAARFIHRHSSRADKPFKAINCGAIPTNLIESELFGYEKGAFTGATRRKAGLFEACDGGSVLLDEIGEMPFDVQVKLLRVLQESEVTRLGGHEAIGVDVRLIAATNRDLSELVREKRFRQDLFFRLSVLTITLPPLREREEDLFLLAEFFAARYCEQFGLPPRTLDPHGRVALANRFWPGNVRELENAIQKAVLLSSGSTIDPAMLGEDPRAHNDSSDTGGAILPLKEVRARAERCAIERALKTTGGNVSLASKLLSIDRAWLTKRIDEYAIDVERYRDPRHHER